MQQVFIVHNEDIFGKDSLLTLPEKDFFFIFIFFTPFPGKHPENIVFLFSITCLCNYRAAVTADLNKDQLIFTLLPVWTWLESLIQLAQSPACKL